MNTNNTRKSITIEFFIVPNPGTCYDGVTGNGPVRAHLDAWTMKNFIENVNAINKFGINPYDFGDEALDITLSDIWAQVWCVLPDSGDDNATDHGIPRSHFLNQECDRKACPGALPARFIEKFAKDGDTVTTTIKTKNGEEVDLVWVAAQSKYRYRNFGDISETLRTVTNRCKQYSNEEGKKALDAYLAAINEEAKRDVA